MGQVISDLVAKDANAEIVAGIDIADKGNTTYPVFTDIKACQTEADVVIDFSSESPVVQSTTGRLRSTQKSRSASVAFAEEKSMTTSASV